MTTKPMGPAAIRRLMARELDAASLRSAERNERIAFATLRILQQRGVLPRAQERAA